MTTWRDVFEVDSAGGGGGEDAEQERGFFTRLKLGLSRSRDALRAELGSSLFETLDSETWERLEEALILADVGAPTTASIVGRLEAEAETGKFAGAAAVRERLIDLMAEIAGGEAATDGGDGESRRIDLRAKPSVIMVVGVNGAGKTTTIGKLADVLRREFGLRVIVAAGDTYRAAATEQLETWAQRSDVEIVRGAPGGDPGAVVFDALAAAEARGADVVIADTAGRLHTQDNLMAELGKIRKVAAGRIEGAPHETLIVIDATTGQNGLRQARLFAEVADVTGVVLTKLDGTAKGGIALAITHELGIPVKLIGVGEGLQDLRPFDARQFAEALLAE